ncbi:dorsal-ventral patterning protein Sog-like [Artemia franciscana]|uniref:VWFC domain-containing protein n=1 Tax=Artemia franciscana TaxID=6661 RepID=A0AA88HQH1_ARTSF|nr:hypothetical protein QYM36_013528 [Artemia franciscana]
MFTSSLRKIKNQHDYLFLDMTTPKVPSSMKSCYFEGDKKYYSAGSKWHPYLPPFGFDKCALCSCNAGTLRVECTRLTCPEPQCPESDRYRPDPKSCCQECRIPEPTQPTKNYENDGEQDEEAQAKSDADILAAGGCRFKGEMFENGGEWNPRILPWGEMKCINCNCKDGRVKCKRRKCVKNRCVAGTRQVKDECCPPCAQEKLKRSKRKKTKRRRTLVSKQ